MKNPLEEFDNKKLNRFHIKTTLIAGAGQIVDGYDLTAGSLVFFSIESYFGSSLTAVSLMLFASIISGNIVGAVLFGYLARHGRKKFYGIDAMLMIFGALLTLFITTPYELVLLRFILGMGIGADYVLSPLINAEYANVKNRGTLLGISGGVMWNLGALISALVTLSLENVLPTSVLWRVVLALGSIPAIAVVVFRRMFPETPHYLAYVKKDLNELKEKYGLNVSSLPDSRIILRAILPTLILASLTWYLYDIVAYSGVFFGPNVIAEKLGLNGIVFMIIILGIFSTPWNFLGAVLSDKIGRRATQAIGFIGMGVATLVFAVLIGKVDAVITLIIYGISSIFNSLGPGNIVGYWGVELFPAKIRGITMSITVLFGRLGVLTTTFLFPILLESLGITPVMVILGFIAILAALVTMRLPEPSQKSLSQVEFGELSKAPVIRTEEDKGEKKI